MYKKIKASCKKKTAEPNILDEISGSDVSIHPSDDYSYCSDDYEDEVDIDVDDDDDDDDDVEMVRIILLYYRDEILKIINFSSYYFF